MGQINLFARDLNALNDFGYSLFPSTITLLLVGVRSIIYMVDLQEIKFAHRTTQYKLLNN